jgi:NADH dehydrogenase/putative oxidoreductase
MLDLGRDALQLADRGFGPILDLIIRLALAAPFLRSGLLKLASWDTALELARSEYPVSWLDPVTAATTGLAIEIVCPVLIAVRLMTRLAAIPLAPLSLVIQFSYLALPEHLFWAILCGALIVRGPGAISLDALLAPALSRSALPFAALAQRLAGLADRYVQPLYQLFIRLWMAEIFWTSGMSKIASWETTLDLFREEYRVPLLPLEIAAYLGTATELGAPVLLALGLGTRFAAIPLLCMTLVIQFTYLDKLEHFYWMMLLAHLALRGGGALTLDALVGRWLACAFPVPSLESLGGAPKVVIVGAGFGGLAAASGLRHARAQVTVIDRRNYHLFQPLLYQVASASLSPAEIAQPIRGILREQANTRVLMERVTAVDWQQKQVVAGHLRIPYDYLVLATGARHDYFGRDDWEKDAPGLKKIDDATKMRGRILQAFEDAEAASDPAHRAALLTFVVVGAGPTGVELAGAIAELARFGMDRDFRTFDPTTARVILVQSGSRVLPAFPEALSAKALAQLEALGVEVRLNTKVTHVDEYGVTIGNDRIPARTVLWAAGVIASSAAKWLKAPADRAGRIKVAADLSVPERPGVYALGDTALVAQADGTPVPGLAPAAKQAGAHVARLIGAQIAGRGATAPFRYRHMGSMATIGRKAAIADFGLLRLSGMLAWWLWGAVHVAFLFGARNRLAVMLDWAWAYLTYRRSIRLITGETR